MRFNNVNMEWDLTMLLTKDINCKKIKVKGDYVAILALEGCLIVLMILNHFCTL